MKSTKIKLPARKVFNCFDNSYVWGNSKAKTKGLRVRQASEGRRAKAYDEASAVSLCKKVAPYRKKYTVRKDMLVSKVGKTK